MASSVENAHGKLGVWIAECTPYVAVRMLASVITIILEVPLWIIASPFLLPCLLIVRDEYCKNAVLGIICMRHIQIFLSAAFAKDGSVEDEFVSDFPKLDDASTLLLSAANPQESSQLQAKSEHCTDLPLQTPANVNNSPKLPSSEFGDLKLPQLEPSNVITLEEQDVETKSAIGYMERTMLNSCQMSPEICALAEIGAFECRFVFPKLIEELYIKVDKNIGEALNSSHHSDDERKRIELSIKKIRAYPWNMMINVLDLTRDSKKDKINKNEFEQLYISIFNKFIKRINNTIKGKKIHLLTCSKAKVNLSNDRELAATDINTAITHSEIVKKTSISLLNRIHTKKVINFINKITGNTYARIAGAGNCSIVYEACLKKDQNINRSEGICIKEISDDKGEADSFAKNKVAYFFEQQTRNRPNLDGRTMMASWVGELFVMSKKYASPTHSAHIHTHNKKKYLIMSKCGDMPLYKFRTEKKECLTEEAIISLILCQFFSQVIGHLDFHGGNCIFDGCHFRVIDMGNTYPPFDITNENTRDDNALNTCLEWKYDCPAAEMADNRKEIIQLIEKNGTVCKNASCLCGNEILEELSKVRYWHIADMLEKGILAKITNKNDCIENIKNHRETIRQQCINDPKESIHAYTELPPLTKEIKKLFSNVLDACEKNMAREMQKYSFTEKEIAAAMDRIEKLKLKLNSAQIIEGTYLSQSKDFFESKSILGKIKDFFPISPQQS
ncbi:MAG: hypothetical protein LBI69_00290 [Puniceicoccales bacterium]|jgi:hypothetical protein|nr:hypothetical protein [Puniceicoccales bacterium]